jgi:serine/threonine protein phosphatase PrpC
VRTPSTTFTWRSASATSQGNVRQHNEDAVLELPGVGLWAVADGMGGHDAGDVASRMIVEALCIVPRPQLLSELLDSVEDHLRAVNQRLYDLSVERGGVTTGSTVAALLALGAHSVSVWAGDSRVYRLRGSSLTRVTEDHTEGEGSNVITRAVGGSEELYLDRELLELQDGDRYLLCSDGLYRELSDADLARDLAGQDVTSACKTLLSHALAGSCRDNVSVVVVEFSALVPV